MSHNDILHEKLMTEMEIYTNLPLTEATFLIMLSLTAGPKHGYAILKDVETTSEHHSEKNRCNHCNK